MTNLAGTAPDVMQVCRNGHVITHLLRNFPERGLSHCERCGATTLDHCLTCGRPLPGATFVPGMVPLGQPEPPQFCSTCGASFPWTKQPPATSSPLSDLETLLRRVPRAIRELRSRHGERTPFRVGDEHDLADLLRALLPVRFNDVRLESRTPSYSADTRTDLVLGAERIAIVAKRTTPLLGEPQLRDQRAEDIAYYERERRCRTLLVFVYDPQSVMLEPEKTERAWSQQGDLDVCCVIAR
jgi:hypothetical protein